ncbi:monovalent cation/H(+) antiporter subunit G [Clostridium sp. MD294]|uniref:cation:proton antiporter n=1 Tax=Clostridium sp. MD294 TaxID=97138 RepID=UPI0002CA6FCA|nr:monovalent cation/H(+) antiporter subunit G [Clostridium sp. MD294]USF28682.1 Na(+)/H(+) antiporter subunit G [Clostridium sp. MD294]
MSNVIGILFVLVGMFVFAVSVLGLYRFHYTLNRMHAAALADTLGTALVMIGLMILGLDIFHVLKLFLVVLFLWITSPVSSHLISKTEILTNLNLEERMKNK